MKKNGIGASGVMIGLALVAASLAITSPAKANVGRTPGTFHVSAEGAATYTIPIWAPRGPNGLEPHIALTYGSQSGKGYLGVGWSVSGLSAITRCNTTYAQDGNNATGIELQTSDGYCLDGERLALTSGTYGAAGSTYLTELNNLEQVTAEQSAGNGPGYFDVKDRNGVTYEYGYTGGSRVLANGTTTAWQWWLDKITDPAGNTLTIQYSAQNATGTVVPSVISWTPEAYGSSTYNYTMQFSYGTNTTEGSPYGYVAGTVVTNSNLLNSISISYGGALVKEYFLTYQASANTNKKELSQVQECADSAKSNCLEPTNFSYYQDSQGNGVSSGSTTLNLGGAANWYLTGYDLNGDGYRDLVFQVGTTWYVAFGSASGYGTPISTGINTAQYSPSDPTFLAGDLLGDGQDGLLADNNGAWFYYTWNGSSFSGVNTALAYNSSAIAFALVDTTGDGKPNLVELLVDSSGDPDVYIVPNTSSGGTLSFGSAVLAYTNTDGSSLTWVGGGLRGPDSQHDAPITHFDFDGNGSDDLILHMRWYSTQDLNGKIKKIPVNASWQLLSDGTAFAGTTFAYNPTYYFLDWDDSKCTDSIYGTTLYVSACDGNAAATYELPGAAVAAMDWDGGGRDDVLYDSGGVLYVQPSTGSGLGAPFSTGITYNSSATYSSSDINADGLDDLLTWTGSTLTVNMHTGQGEPIDTLSEIQDGYGNTISPQYASLTQGAGSTYTSAPQNTQVCSLVPATDCSDNYLGTLYVVKSVTYSDPSNPQNGTYTRTHQYSGALEDIAGRGFSGFATHSVTDSRNDLTEKRTFSQAFPYTFMPTQDVVTDNATGSTVESTTDTLAEVGTEALSAPEIWFPYVSASTRKDYEVNGSENGDLIRTTASTFAYDDYGNLTSSSQTVTDNDPGSPYSGSSWTTSVANTPDADTSTWCLSLLTQTQVTYSDTYDNSSITRTRQFTPDLNNCRYAQIVTAPGSSSYQVTEDLVYDNFGNIDSDTVTGVNMPSRTTTTYWGSSTSGTGQFPLSVTDPAGATTSFNYKFELGLVSSTTDPNGLTTSWRYSPLGRLSQETRPDGTYTTWSRSAYSGSDPLPRMVVTEQAHDTAGNVIRTTTEEFDMLDRPYLEQTNLLDGSTATVMQKTYDSLGRVVSEQEPYEGGTVGAVSYSYDALNRLTEAQRPTSASDSTPATTTYQYQGDTTIITDANNDTRTLVHDVNGWLRQSEDDLGYQVIFGYDAAGSRTSVTDNQGNTLWTGTWAYGVAPFLTGETEMDSGDWGFVVDALGNRTAWTDPKNQHFSEQYDLLSRPEARSEPDLFTQWTWGSSAAAHNIGKLASVCTGTGQNPTACSGAGASDSWTYDGDGRLYQRAISLPSMGTYTYTWQYNSATGMPQSLTYPTGTSGQALTLQYGYAYGYLQSITDTLDSPNVVIWQADAMNPAGQVTQDTLGNGIVTTRAFDAVTHFLTSVQSGEGGGTAVQNMSFLYDPVGNVSQRQDNNLGLTENFYYDGDDRLHYSTLNGTQNLSMTYDAMGNITNRSDVANNATWTYDPNHKHQVTEAGSTAYEYVYDANGNMTSRAGSSITWTSYNYPSAIDDSATGESVALDYGPNRNPWLETTQEPSGTTETYRLGGLMDMIVGGSANTDRDYIYAGNDPVAVDERSSSSNRFYYFQTDQQGSISSITNASGQVAVNESFAAYGARRNPATWSGSPSTSDLTTIAGITQHGYTFQRALDEQMGLNDMVGRVQDATIGRFVSADPAMPRTGNPQSWNIYSYVYNNPLSFVDPTGFACQLFNGNDLEITETITVGGLLIGVQLSINGPGASGTACGGSSDAANLNEYDGSGAGNGANGSPSKEAKYTNQQQSKPTQCTVLQKIAGTLENQLAQEINGLSLSFGGDFLYGTGSQSLYGGGSVSVSNQFEVSLSITTSNSLQGSVYGAFGGLGPGFTRSSGPVVSGNSATSVAVGGYAAIDSGVMASGAMDATSTSLPAPSISDRGDVTGGLGFGGARGSAQTTTYVLIPPLVPNIPMSGCHL